MILIPDGWVIFKITPKNNDDDTFHKIFATWRLEEAWRFSSGAFSLNSLLDRGDYFEWVQESGSVYKLTKDGEDGFTYYTGSVMHNIVKKLKEEEFIVERLKIGNHER